MSFAGIDRQLVCAHTCSHAVCVEGEGHKAAFVTAPLTSASLIINIIIATCPSPVVIGAFFLFVFFLPLIPSLLSRHINWRGQETTANIGWVTSGEGRAAGNTQSSNWLPERDEGH